MSLTARPALESRGRNPATCYMQPGLKYPNSKLCNLPRPPGNRLVQRRFVVTTHAWHHSNCCSRRLMSIRHGKLLSKLGPNQSGLTRSTFYELLPESRGTGLTSANETCRRKL